MHTPNLTGEPRCQDCPIRHRAVCSHCAGSDLDRLEDIKYYRTYAPGQGIVWAGDELGFVGSVVRGAATMSQTLEDGRRQTVGLLLPSDFIGRPGRALSQFDIFAVSEITLCCFRKRPFEQLLQDIPDLGRRLLDMTLDELDAAREWMLVLGRKTAREKLASLLALIARREAAIGAQSLHKPLTIDLLLSREAIADHLGLTIETVSRQFSALKSDNIIRMEGTRRVQIPNYATLMAQSASTDEFGV